MSTEVTASAGPNQSQPSSAPSATATAPATTRRIGCTSGSLRLRSERVQSWPFNGAASSGLGRLLKRGSNDRRLRNLTPLSPTLPPRGGRGEGPRDVDGGRSRGRPAAGPCRRTQCRLPPPHPAAARAPSAPAPL